MPSLFLKNLFMNFFYYICIDVLLTSMRVYLVYAWYPKRPEEDVGGPETEVTVGCKLPCEG